MRINLPGISLQSCNLSLAAQRQFAVKHGKLASLYLKGFNRHGLGSKVGTVTANISSCRAYASTPDGLLDAITARCQRQTRDKGRNQPLNVL